MRRGRHKGDTAAFRDAMFATLCKVWNPRIVPLSVKLGLFRAVVGSVLLYNAVQWLPLSLPLQWGGGPRDRQLRDDLPRRGINTKYVFMLIAKRTDLS